MTARLRELLDELRDDPDALAELRALVGATPAIYSPATLGAELGITARAVRAAIERGDLQARRSGRGYVIGADAVAAWTTTTRRRRRSPRPRPMRDPMAERS